MDDVRGVVREGDPFRLPEVASDEADVEVFEKTEVGGLPDQAVDPPAKAQEMTAEVGPDEPVGAGDQDAAHGDSAGPVPAHRFHALCRPGERSRTGTAAATPMTISAK